jgi:hypothetical protein
LNGEQIAAQYRQARVRALAAALNGGS